MVVEAVGTSFQLPRSFIYLSCITKLIFISFYFLRYFLAKYEACLIILSQTYGVLTIHLYVPMFLILNALLQKKKEKRKETKVKQN